MMRKLLILTLSVMSVVVLSACTRDTAQSNASDNETVIVNTQEAESTPGSINLTDISEIFSSDELGLCFFYPKGYEQIPTSGSVQIAAPVLPGTDTKGLFWLEISDSDNRDAEEIADQEMADTVGLDVGRWSLTLDGEQAVVLDGMPGQNLQRRVIVVHRQNLYVLAFWPTLSENKAANDQMESLYDAIIDSWNWSPCE